jgi:mono/diheme cytochrome c family protein
VPGQGRCATGRAAACVARVVATLATLAALGSGADAARGDDAAAIAARRARARAAAEAWLRADFFTDGRGVTGLPLYARAWRPGRSLVPFLGVDDLLRDEMGFAHEGGLPTGLANRCHEGVAVPAVGCAACHAGRAAGRTIPGLGNKTIDPASIGRVLLSHEGLSRALTPRGTASAMADRALRFARVAADPRWTNLTPGLVSDFLIVHWFYAEASEPVPADPPRLQVKVPHLWGLAQKAEAGLFCDGFGRAEAWAAMQEVTAGQRPEGVRSYLGRLRGLLEEAGDLLPPRWPGRPLDAAAVIRGSRVFAARCAECHGEHARDALGFPVFATPRMVPIEEVATDPDRHRAFQDPRLGRLVHASPLGDLLALSEEPPPGYLAPRLDGVWARFPYLHNASVPTLADLLAPAAARPRAWSVREAGEAHRFDGERVGLTVPREAAAAAALLRRGRRGERSVYWVGREGHSNEGHEFGVDLDPDAKRDLLEYLRSL